METRNYRVNKGGEETVGNSKKMVIISDDHKADGKTKVDLNDECWSWSWFEIRQPALSLSEYYAILLIQYRLINFVATCMNSNLMLTYSIISTYKNSFILI